MSTAAGMGQGIAVVLPLQSTLASTMAFGTKQWGKHIGEVGEEPPFPANIDDILRRPCPFSPGMEVFQTHDLALIPATINGEKWDLGMLGQLFRKPKEGAPVHCLVSTIDSKRVLGPEKSYWVLMPRSTRPLPVDSTQQLKQLNRPTEKANQLYHVPRIAEVIIAIATHYFESGGMLFVGKSIGCQESGWLSSPPVLSVFTGQDNAFAIKIGSPLSAECVLPSLIRL